MQPSPLLNDALDKMIAIGLVVLEIFKFENVDARTDGRMDERRLDYYTISSPVSLRLR